MRTMCQFAHDSLRKLMWCKETLDMIVLHFKFLLHRTDKSSLLAVQLAILKVHIFEDYLLEMFSSI